MLDDFLVRAVVGGVGVALITGPLGCFVVWRRMAFFGDTVAHASLLGIALALALEVNATAGVFVAAALVAVIFGWMRRASGLPSSITLGILAHSALALGIIVVSFMPALRIDLFSYLFGDILSLTVTDIAVIYGGTAIAGAVLAVIWRPLLTSSVSEELAAAETSHPAVVRTVFIVLLAAVIAGAMKIVGILLVTSLLIIPAAAARQIAGTPEWMAVASTVAGLVAVVGGLMMSLHLDTPSGPSIVAIAMAIFVLCAAVSAVVHRKSAEAAA